MPIPFMTCLPRRVGPAHELPDAQRLKRRCRTPFEGILFFSVECVGGDDVLSRPDHRFQR